MSKNGRQCMAHQDVPEHHCIECRNLAWRQRNTRYLEIAQDRTAPLPQRRLALTALVDQEVQRITWIQTERARLAAYIEACRNPDPRRQPPLYDGYAYADPRANPEPSRRP